VVAGIFGQGTKARIQELEQTLEEHQRALEEARRHSEAAVQRSERADERRREAVAARQAAEEKTNRLETRIAQLEGELDRLQGSTPQAPTVAAGPQRRMELQGRRTELMLQRLLGFEAAEKGALTATLHEPGDPMDQTLQRALGDRVQSALAAASCLVLLDDTGILSLAVQPPLLPNVDPVWDDRFHLQREWFLPTGRYAFVLARSALLAAGIYENEELVAFKGMQPRVGRRHSRGGFSQGRFERIREEQIADHLKRCRETLKEFLGEDIPVYLVGQKETIEALKDTLRPVATRTVDATGAPREALEDAFRSFWTTKLRAL
jgi:hypothetical protein